MGQNHSQDEYSSPRKPERITKQPPKAKTLPQFQQHQGILKLRKVPFRNSIQISQQPSLFLENIPDTLADILESRYNTNRYFSQLQIQQFVESVLYTLSFLQTKGITYNNLCTQNIHYDDDTATYKLLPIQLINQGLYEEALKSKKFGLLSPQLILGLRYRERNIESDIMNKSNVFTFGMILLEIATLQPSIQCYDLKQSEILDDVITERLEKVQDVYQPQIERLIQIMIEYDYTKRMNLQELSILVNKTLAQNGIANSNSMKRSKSFSRFKNIDQSLSEKPDKQSFSKTQQKSGIKNISPSRLKANTGLPVNYHQTPKRQSIQYTTSAPPPQPQTQQPQCPQLQPQSFPQHRSARRITCGQQQQEQPYYYHQQPQEYPQPIPHYIPYPPPGFVPPAPMYAPPPGYSQIPYRNPYQYPQYSQYQNHSSAYQYPEPNPSHYPSRKGSTIFHHQPAPKPTAVYYQPEPDTPHCQYNPPQRLSTPYYPVPQSPYSPVYEEPAKHNPYINYQQPTSKQLSFEQEYEDSFSKNQFPPSNILKNHNYGAPQRDTNFVLKQNNHRKAPDLCDLSDSSIVKIKEEIAKSRELIMELQRHDSGNRR